MGFWSTDVRLTDPVTLDVVQVSSFRTGPRDLPHGDDRHDAAGSGSTPVAVGVSTSVRQRGSRRDVGADAEERRKILAAQQSKNRIVLALGRRT